MENLNLVLKMGLRRNFNNKHDQIKEKYNRIEVETIKYQFLGSKSSRAIQIW